MKAVILHAFGTVVQIERPALPTSAPEPLAMW